MTPYFTTPERRDALLVEARSWLGTPFRAHGRQKSFGVDCAGLAYGIYYGIGFLRQQAIPAYTMDSGQHLETSWAVACIAATGQFDPIKLPVAYQTGDLLAVRAGRVEHHLGIVTDMGRFIHVMRGGPVSEMTLRDPTWSSRITSVWRPIE